MKFGQLFLRSLSRFGPAKLFLNRPQAINVSLTTLSLGFATWFSTSKYFAEEVTILETEDDLKDGEVR